VSPGQSTSERSGSAAGRTARAAYPYPVRVSLQDLPITIAPSTAGATPNGAGLLALSLPAGRWTPPGAAYGELTLSLVSGVMLRTSGRLTDLLLPGDISEVDPVVTERWRVLSPDGAVILFLSAATVADMVAVPGVTQALLRARSRQHERALELRSIVGIYDVEERILSFFAHLARHVGRPERAATRIPLRLEQRRVEEILRAGHTQATTAFRLLFARGALVHDADGWLIRCPTPNASSAGTGSAPNTTRV
jgi:hypothetical protein